MVKTEYIERYCDRRTYHGAHFWRWVPGDALGRYELICPGVISVIHINLPGCPCVDCVNPL